MKFLQHDGDSVVSLRFVYQEVPSGRYEDVDNVPDTLTFDTVGEIQDALADLFESGEAPFNLQEHILDLDAIRAGGDYTQADMVNQLAAFQNNLNGMLSANEEFPDVSDFMNALQEFMNQADDLGEFKEETNVLSGEVQQYAAHVEAGAKALAERATLSALVEATIKGHPNRATEIGLKEESQRPTGAEVAHAAVLAKAEELPVRLSEIGPNVEAAIASQMGESAFVGFNPNQFA